MNRIPLAPLGLTLGIIGLRWPLLTRVRHYWLTLGGRIGFASFFIYQHLSRGNMKLSHWGSEPMRGHRGSGFTLQWNIGL